MTESRPESFPCIICGKTLKRAWHLEAQPSDGIMCETAGNYGSTIFDSQDGARLAFNICDPCMVKAGSQGRVMTYRKYKLILIGEGPLHHLVVGKEYVDQPYTPWSVKLDRDTEPVLVPLEELEHLSKNCVLDITLSQIRSMIGGKEND